MIPQKLLFSFLAAAVGAGYALCCGFHALRSSAKNGNKGSARRKRAALGAALAAGYALALTVAFAFFT